MVDVYEVAENIYMIDDQVCSIPKLGSVYLLNEEKKALVDTGPPSSAGVVLEGIRKVGVKPEDINYVIATHIHLDHAGGAGVLLKEMPQAQVVVHHKGAQHLIDPTELLESAKKALGPEIIALHGEVIPVESHRVQLIYDNDTIKLSDNQVLEFIDAPGHAEHELCIYETRNGGLFVGDALGLYLAEGEVLFQGHPPPSFEPEVCVNTIQRLMKLNASLIYFAHFGASDNVQDTLQLAIDKIQYYGNMVAKAAEEGSLDNITGEMAAQIREELEPVKKVPAQYEFVIKNLVPASVAGFMHYQKRKGKAGLNG